MKDDFEYSHSGFYDIKPKGNTIPFVKEEDWF